ncbi:MAG: protein-disulfide reductase DsbD family protein [Spirochaetota bacterium]
MTFRQVSLFIAFIALLFISVLFIACGEDKPTDLHLVPGTIPAVHAGDGGYFTVTVRIPGNAHIYANPRGPGTGKATTVFTESPDGIGTGKPVFERGTRYVAPGEREHVNIYEESTSITIPFSTASSLPVDMYSVEVTIDALLCDEGACIPLRKTIIQEISVIPPEKPATVFDNERIQSADAPRVAPETKDAAVKSDEPVTIEGLKTRYLHTSPVNTILTAIIFGIIAGFILNFMPCVLPVVSLKVMSIITHAGKDRRQVTLMGLLFAGGILASFTALAALATFAGYNWGELFQQQWFLVAMITIIFAMALSMFGVFTFNVPSFAAGSADHEGNPYLDSFLKGLLATLLATPCSGPFLGGTLAWAMLQPPYVIFVIFMSIGAGMALPYLVLTLRPQLMRYIPAPGNWMITFEHIMAFLLGATVIYLLGILDPGSRYSMLWFLFFVSLGLWQYGRYAGPGQPARKRLVSLVILLLIITMGEVVSFRYLSSPGSATPQAAIKSDTFSIDALNDNRNIGIITLVKFTADWCPNCRLVEATSLNTEQVREALSRYNARVLTADLTQKNPEAESLLEKLGSRSIPFLAVFPPGDDFFRPFGLRDIYSEEEVLEAIRKAAVTQTFNGSGTELPDMQEIIIK